MKLLERLLFYPVLLAATVLAGAAAYRHPGSLSYAGLAGVALIWLVAFVRGLLWMARIVFYLTCLGVLAALWVLGPWLTEMMRTR